MQTKLCGRGSFSQHYLKKEKKKLTRKSETFTWINGALYKLWPRSYKGGVLEMNKFGFISTLVDAIQTMWQEKFFQTLFEKRKGKINEEE